MLPPTCCFTAAGGCRDHAWGQDELLPLSKAGGRWFNLGLTLVDGLDTLLLMRLDSEWEDARAWVASSLKVDPDLPVRAPTNGLVCFMRPSWWIRPLRQSHYCL